MKKFLSFVLALVMVIGLLPMNVFAVSADNTIALDSLAWEDLTYRDIFITNNKAYLDGFNNRTFTPYIQNAGTNTITTDACYTAPYSMAAFGSTSQQIKSVNPLPVGDYFIASKAYCTRYAAGELGVCLHSTTVGVTEVTDGFVTAAGIISAENSGRIFIGSIHSADLDGYVDDTVVVNMSIFNTKPTEAELTTMYEQYVEIEKAIEREEVPYTEQEMLDAFVVCMNERAASIGMTSSNFVEPIGIDNITTAADLLRLMVYAYTNYETLNGIWCQSSHTMTVSGKNAREQTVNSTIIKPALEDYYHILGGKTGTLSKFDARNLAVILEIPESEDRLAVIALYADGLDTDANNRFEAARQIADAALAKYFEPSMDNSATDVCCASAIACLIPAEGVDMGDLEVLYEKDSQTQRVPASITKVLTAICALDYMDDLMQTVTYSDFDTQIGGYYTKDFYPGDSLTFEDALYAMLLPSSNVTARMVARVAGGVLLKNTHCHTYTSAVTAPTCTEQGYTTYTCACGDSYVADYVEATGHTYENGTCTVCGEAAPSLEGKTISILGASISTFGGTSNGIAAETTNSTIGENVQYYPHSTVNDVTLNDTWWMQVCSDLGLRLLVNNSWSGSSLLHTRSGTVGAYVDRCVQLHDDTGDNAGEEPDIIGIQMGTNDFQYYKDTLGTADIDYNALITENGDGSHSYAEPTTSLEAAAIVLHKISVRYPDAEVYYLNISQRIDGTDELIRSFNAELKQVVEHFGAHIVDIYGSAITMAEFDTYIGDGRVHPNCLGMDAYAEAFKRALLEHTVYAVDTHTVSMELDGVTADYGDDKIVVSGDAFSVRLTAADDLKVTVTMGGKDITDQAYSSGTVTIDAVTDDVTITAESTHISKNYRWEFDGTDLVCVSGDNPLTKNAGTTTDGVFSKTRYALASEVVLLHNLPWAVEWRCEGTFLNTGGSSGARIFTSDAVNANYNARYIFKSNTNGLIAMGEKDTKGSHNYGIALGDHGIDWTELHTYRLENRVAENGSNVIYLFVDGVEIGPMNNYYVGTADKETTSDWLSGKDFVFPYMGTDTHGFTNCSIEYIAVWEGGHTHAYTPTVTAPTCTEQGYTTYTCTCGDSYVADLLDATGHTYENGTCTSCGAEHPNLANFEGKVISILGDSISTFAGYIPVADGFNLEHLARYPQDNLLTDVNETWWMQVITELGAKLGINDSWRGATVSGAVPVTTGTTGENAAMSNLTRIQNLGSNGTPDVIFFYGGTNDLAHVSKVGSFDPDTAPTAVDLTTKKWDNLADAYVQTLLRLRHFYPDAQIVCLLPTFTTSYYSDTKLAQANEVLAQICEHYGVAYTDLRECGIATGDLPDGIHPDAAGMDFITGAAVETLLNECEMEAGENVVHSVTHMLTGAESSLGYYKGVTHGKSFVTEITGEDVTVSVTMGGADITNAVYADGVVTIAAVTDDVVITAQGRVKNIYEDHLQQLPDDVCAGVNLWNVLEHDREYYTVSGWGVHTSGKVYSVTFPVSEGDRIFATSFGTGSVNGSGGTNGIRVTYFFEDGSVRSVSAGTVYGEFSVNGYLTIPEGVLAVNVPMWTVSDSNELYILNRPHIYGDWYESSAGEERRDCLACENYETRKAMVAVVGESEYSSLDAAIEAAAVNKETVALLTDLEVPGVFIPKGVTLDLADFTLTTNYLIGLKGSCLTAEPNAGKLIVEKDSFFLPEEGYKNASGQYVLPIWDPVQNCYLFSLFVVNTNNAERGLFIDEENETIRFQFKHQATGDINKGLLGDGSSDNALKVIVRLVWSTGDGEAYQDFVYNDGFVKKVAVGENGVSYDYSFTLSGYSAMNIQLDTLTVTAMIITDSGAVAIGTEWTAETAK